MPNKPAVVAEGLQKSYGKTRALAGIDLAAQEGSRIGESGFQVGNQVLHNPVERILHSASCAKV